MFRMIFFTDNKLNLQVVFVTIISVVSGIAKSLIPLIISKAAEELINKGDVPFKYLPYFLAALGILIISKWVALRKTIEIVERSLEKYRNKIGNQLRQSELILIENLDKGEIYTKITIDTRKVSRVSQSGILVIQSLVTVICILGYIFQVSAIAGFFYIILAFLGFLNYKFHQRPLCKTILKAAQKETEVFDDFGHVLDGFKELKITREKNSDLFHNCLKPLLHEAKELRSMVGEQYIKISIFSFTLLFYASVAMVTFLLPSDMAVSLKFEVFAMSTFLWAPISLMSVMIPELFQAGASAERLYQLERQLESIPDPDEYISRNQTGRFHDFMELQIKDICFDYTDKDGNQTFSLGPASLTLKAGEILFFVGGNGSGKSTLMKMITGLYPPLSGAFLVNGLEVRMTDHRYLFSAVYTDCRLFDGLYGTDNIDDEKVYELLRTMGLVQKVSWQDRHFHHSGLSTGQGKRLAMITALLEDKPIYVFDEWTSEQDPEFRISFYEELLPELKSKGKTIIAATHDDRYFHIADRVVEMQYGLLKNQHA
ncbi:MAG: ATP-binding cassette domain-containing protein [Desulfobacteraceae bacterium]|nr:ATP-binding cassette domain-containing protein [Desulfobacteraceae bacterium]